MERQRAPTVGVFFGLVRLNVQENNDGHLPISRALVRVGGPVSMRPVKGSLPVSQKHWALSVRQRNAEVFLQARLQIAERIPHRVRDRRFRLDAKNFADSFIENITPQFLLHNQPFLGFGEAHMGLDMSAGFSVQKITLHEQPETSKE